MLPAWAAVAIAIGGSVLGGLVVGVLRMRFERQEHLRQLMIEAATDFSKAVLEALSALRKAVQELRRLTEDELASSSGGVSPQAREVMKEAVEKAEEAEEQLPRFLLLFGRSRVTHAAVRQVNALREAVSWASATSPNPLGSQDDQYDVKSEIFKRINEADEAQRCARHVLRRRPAFPSGSPEGVEAWNEGPNFLVDA